MSRPRFISILKNSRRRCWTVFRSSAPVASGHLLKARPSRCRKAMETKIMTRYFLNRRFRLALSLFVGMGFLSGCAVGPNYKRPSVNVPAAYRAPAPEGTSAASSAQPPANTGSPQAPAASLGDEKWWEVFQDKELQGLIRTALKSNYDVRIAATRVLQARAQVGITRADQYPTLNAGGNITSERSPAIGPVPSF